MEWEDIDNLFRDYERLCRKSPTTDELVEGLLKMGDLYWENRYSKQFLSAGLLRVYRQTKLEEFDVDE